MSMIIVAWLFVVVLMAIVEAMSAGFLAGLSTLLFFAVLPLTILIYLTRSSGCRKSHAQNLEDGIKPDD